MASFSGAVAISDDVMGTIRRLRSSPARVRSVYALVASSSLRAPNAFGVRTRVDAPSVANDSTGVVNECARLAA